MVTPDITTRTCTRCHNTYPLTSKHFKPRKQSPSGYEWRCRSCISEIKREYCSRPEIRSRNSAYRRNRYRRLKTMLQNERDQSAYPESANAEQWVSIKGF